MSSLYSGGQRKLQNQFDTIRLADRIEERLVQRALDEADISLIESQFMFFLATADKDGQPSCSFKGGDRGFVRVVDATTLAFPDYNGNGMYLSLGNVVDNPKVGLLFIDFEKQSRLRVNGHASVSSDDPLMSEYPGAKSIVRVSIEVAFPNCSRYIPRMSVVEMSRFIPKGGQRPELPEWKRSDWARDVLPADEQI